MKSTRFSKCSRARQLLLSLFSALVIAATIACPPAFADDAAWAARGELDQRSGVKPDEPVVFAASKEPGSRSQQPQASGPMDMRDEGYNPAYIFGMTKGVANSTITPAIKPLFFLITVPLDIVTLPFSLIGGFF